MENISPSIDSVREFWNNRPCNIRHSNLPFGSKEYFDEVERRKYFVEPHIVAFADFPRWRSKSVLEIGCGIGTDAINFVRSGAEYTGVELSEESLKITRMRLKTYGLAGNLVLSDVEKLSEDLNGNSYDFIYSFGVLHHTPNIANALSEIRRLCKPTTTFRFMVYASDSWKNALISEGLDQPEAQYGCPIANTYTKEEIRSLLDLAGFSLVRIEQDHIFPYEISKYVKYEYVLQPWFKSMDSALFRALEKHMGWHLLVEAKPS